MHYGRSIRSLSAFLVLPLVLGGCLMDDPLETAAENPPDTPPAANSPPTIFGTPPNQVAVGQSYAFTPSASDPDGDRLTFSVQNKPSWIAFNESTGALSGTPQSGDLGNYEQIVVSVNDGSVNTALPQFAIAVMGQNSAPEISGDPDAQIMSGDSYSFTPTATDADGDTLLFSIRNAPRWSEFDSSTGTLSGSPESSDLGTYSNIRISVSDGSMNSTLPAFDIEVAAAAMGSATLSWSPPTQNDDGSPLMDLAGYTIYYGTSPSPLETEIQIDNPGITSYVVDNLVPNTYYFAITAVNSAGIESNKSGVASKTIN